MFITYFEISYFDVIFSIFCNGVMFFSKQNKTNQIVPEVTVELRGATIGWAPRDKSSKKNVLEVGLKKSLNYQYQFTFNIKKT